MGQPVPFDLAQLRTGDRLDRDGTSWIVASVDLDDNRVLVEVARVSCNGVPGHYRLVLDRREPHVVERGHDGRRLITKFRAGPHAHRLG